MRGSSLVAARALSRIAMSAISLSMLFACVSSVLMLARPASATLIPIDLPGGNVDEVTFDDATGLYWLDVTETQTLGYAGAPGAANASTGLMWRHAFGSEVCGLLDMYSTDTAFACTGDPPGYADPLTTGTDHTASIRSLFGETGAGYFIGYWDDENGDATSPGVVGVSWDGTQHNNSVTPDFFNNPNFDRGSLLVTTVIPEPGTGLLLGVGLLALAARARQRKA